MCEAGHVHHGVALDLQPQDAADGILHGLGARVLRARVADQVEHARRDPLAGEQITAKLTNAPGNGAAIGGLKVTTKNAWFAARPSGTEDVYKIYAESFKGQEHLQQVQAGIASGQMARRYGLPWRSSNATAPGPRW